jgi:streptogramin lyase
MRRRPLALFVAVPAVAATVAAGIISAPSKTRPCITEFSKGISGSPSQIELGPDGNLWANEGQQDRIARFDLRKKSATEFSVPKRTQLHELETGPDGNLWFTGTVGRLGKLDVRTKEVTLFPGITPGSEPHHLWWGPDGRAYIGEFGAGDLARFDPKTGEITEGRYNLPPNNGIHGYVELPDGSVWWGLQDSDRLARFDVESQRFDKFVAMPKGSGPHWLEYVRSDRAIWVGLIYASKLARYDLETERVTSFDLPLDAVSPAALTSRPPPKSLTFVHQDAQAEALWLPTGPGGEVVRFDLRTHETTRVGCGLTFPIATLTMANDREGNLWVSEGTIGGSGRLGRIDR